MNLSYLNFEMKDNCYVIDDLHMLSGFLYNHCFDGKPFKSVNIINKNRHYNIVSSEEKLKSTLDSIKKSKERLINISKEYEAEKLQLMERVIGYILIGDEYLGPTLDDVLTTLLNETLKTSESDYVSSIYIDTFSEDFASLLNLQKNIKDESISKSFLNTLIKFSTDAKELIDNIYIGEIEHKEKFGFYIDYPVKRTIHKLCGFGRVLYRDERLVYKGELINDLDEKSVKSLKTDRYIYISFIDPIDPSFRRVGIIRLTEDGKVEIK